MTARVEQSVSPYGIDTYTLVVEQDGAKSWATVSLFGAHVESWNDCGVERLFMSPHAVRDGSKALRGGIPVIFPQFNDMGPLSAHGFARTATWKHIASKSEGDAASVQMELTHSDATYEQWPAHFRLVFSITLRHAQNSRLELAMRLQNTGTSSFDTTFALHTYFGTDDVNNATVVGLQGCAYMDNLQGRSRHVETRAAVNFDQEVDRVYVNVPSSLALCGASKGKTVSIEQEGFTDAVVWNPWIVCSLHFTTYFVG